MRSRPRATKGRFARRTLRIALGLCALGLLLFALHPAAQRWAEHWYAELPADEQATLDACALDYDCVAPPSPQWAPSLTGLGRYLLLGLGLATLATLPRARRLDRIADS